MEFVFAQGPLGARTNRQAIVHFGLQDGISERRGIVTPLRGVFLTCENLAISIDG